MVGRAQIRWSVSLRDASSSATETRRPPISKLLQAVFLIAGTTVGGGFLALPATVVIPLGGFLPSAAALCLVWAYLLICSLALCDAILLARARRQQEEKVNDTSPSSDTTTAIGIPKTAQIALGPMGSRTATILLVSLTVATLVSQLSRAGSLFATKWASSSTNPSTMMRHYRFGCSLATIFGALVTHTRRGNDDNDAPTQPNKLVSSNNTTTTTTTSFADKFNTILTAIFLGSAVLLFRAGSQVANWSACWTGGRLFSNKILAASPIMLQLLVYGEILPNVCHMLDHDRRTIRRAVVAGSFIPLMLLTGWAGLGVALMASTSGTGRGGMFHHRSGVDPVDILLASSHGNTAVQTRLLLLALSAIGTTILGSFLALQSAYNDWQSMLPTNDRKAQLMKQSWVRTMAISLPPLAISWISPSLFLQAIDFAGSYPVLLLYGVLPPLILKRLGSDGDNNYFSSIIGVVSTCLVGLNLISDGSSILRRLFLK